MVLLAAAPAAADPCASFADPLAYNACLARQGPAARAVHVGQTPVGRAPSRRARGEIAATTRRGRSEMVFTLGK
jgi:hypothetical protein